MANSEETKDLLQQLFIESSTRVFLLEKLNRSIMSFNKNEDIYSGAWEEGVQFIVKEVAETLDVSRVSLWKHFEEEQYIENQMLYQRDIKEFQVGLKIEESEYPSYFSAIHEEKIICANDVESHPLTKCFTEVYLKPLAIKSMLDIPVFYRGRIWGVVCCEQQHAGRRWTLDESNYVKNVTEFIHILLSNIERNNAYAIIAQHQHEIEEQKLALERKSVQLEQVHTKMIESILYARRIQQAILPPQKLFKDHFKDHFILYNPKDIVSGDVYWFRKIDSRIYLAAIDCTGHGVPGALISIIANYSINRAINEFSLVHPGDILGTVSEIMQEELNRHEDSLVHDGMDIAMLCVDLEANCVEYAGAYNPLLMVRGGVLTKTKADRKPIGYKVMDGSNDFENHVIPYQDGDQFYIYSDGYVDQFGGLKDKKFTNARFENTILEVSTLPFYEQKSVLLRRYLEWKGEEDQIDDVLVMGLRF